MHKAVLLLMALPAMICGFNQRAESQQLPTYYMMMSKRRTPPIKKSRQKKKQQTLESLLELETNLRDRGFNYIIGCDDSGGAGCIAGPLVVASCCILYQPFASFLLIQTSDKSESLVSPSEMEVLRKVNDCKQLTTAQQQDIYDIIHSHPDIFAVSVSQRSPAQIDEINLKRATQEAFAQCIETLVDEHKFPVEETYAIVDGNVSPKLYASQRVQSNSHESVKTFPVRPYVNGDAKVYSVALSSIVARVIRDKAMQQLDQKYPSYGFVDHKGFNRKDHLEAIHKHGSIVGVHRMSFKQVKGR